MDNAVRDLIGILRLREIISKDDFDHIVKKLNGDTSSSRGKLDDITFIFKLKTIDKP